MTEKQYGGSSSHGFREKTAKSGNQKVSQKSDFLTSKKTEKEEYSELSSKLIEDYKKAGHIASETMKYARSFIKKGQLLTEIANKIEKKIEELGGKPAFPTNLSMNEIAAHSTPDSESLDKAEGLLKIDIGVHINGCIADAAFSLDMEDSEENRKIIESSERALKEAVKLAKIGTPLRLIGKTIADSIAKDRLNSIKNLSGHSIEPYEIHAGITIPNYDNAQEKTLEEGVYAIEPFSTTGLGAVRDGKESNIFILKSDGNVRDTLAREILKFIKEEYQTLPFCSRWIINKFGKRAKIALQRIQESGLIHNYPQLIESGNGKVAQTEHTLIITKKETIITTS